MPKLKTRQRVAGSGKFVVDGSYLRTQAREAFSTFMAPLSGVYLAAVGAEASTKTVKKPSRKRN